MDDILIGEHSAVKCEYKVYVDGELIGTYDTQSQAIIVLAAIKTAIKAINAKTVLHNTTVEMYARKVEQIRLV